MNAINVPAADLESFCAACFAKLGLAVDDARLVAESLLFANLRGVDSHGVIRMKIYADRLRAGGFKANLRPRVVSEETSSAVVDAQHGVGQIAGRVAMNLAIGKAARSGAAVVSVRNSNHFGA